jgi:hypothetical protein
MTSSRDKSPSTRLRYFVACPSEVTGHNLAHRLWTEAQLPQTFERASFANERRISEG